MSHSEGAAAQHSVQAEDDVRMKGRSDCQKLGRAHCLSAKLCYHSLDKAGSRRPLCPLLTDNPLTSLTISRHWQVAVKCAVVRFRNKTDDESETEHHNTGQLHQQARRKGRRAECRAARSPARGPAAPRHE